MSSHWDQKQSNVSWMLVIWMANSRKVNHVVYLVCLIIPGQTTEIVLTDWRPFFTWPRPFYYNWIQINKDQNLAQLLTVCQHIYLSRWALYYFFQCNITMLANIDTSWKVKHLAHLACQLISLITTEMVLTAWFLPTTWSWQFPFYSRKRI